MQKFIGFIFIMVVLFFACTGQNDSEASREKLMLTLDTFYAAIEEGNSAKRLALFADSAMMLGDTGALPMLTVKLRNK